MKNFFNSIVDILFSRSISVADIWAIALISLVGGWFWLAIIPWIAFSAYMDR